MTSPDGPFDIVPAPRVGAANSHASGGSPTRWHVLADSDVSSTDAPATAYAPTSLLISHLSGEENDALDVLATAAAVFGWKVAPDQGYRVSHEDSEATATSRRTRLPWATGKLAVTRVLISADPEQAVSEPEAWKLLQRARALRGGQALPVGLDHGLLATPRVFNWPVDVHAAAGRVFNWPVTVTSSTGSPSAEYVVAGHGGREPVRFLGPAPDRGHDKDRRTRRPVIGILDGGCGDHPWLADVRRHVLDASGSPIGQTDPATDPEASADLHGPLDGVVDAFSGHGTFMAGIIRQTCPAADIVSWRLVGSDGTISESDLIRALTQVADLLESTQETLDVLVLALGYYHEDPEDLNTGHLLSETLLRIRQAGTTVVCSAGNDATDVPFFPAAFATASDQTAAPLVSVGALNPNGTVALFSNSGPWVSCYAPGASVLSTTPATDGGLQPSARTTAYGLDRAAIDPDDSSSGFAIWSGTSFAAPYVAGAIAATLEQSLPAVGVADQRVSVDEMWRAVSTATGIDR